MESQMQRVWRNYIRELQRDPDYEIRKAQFLTEKKEKERAAVESEPLMETGNSPAPILTEKEIEHV